MSGFPGILSQHMGERVQRYVRGLRNPGKRAYAIAWLRYCLKLDAEDPKPSASLCTTMAAQAVRMSLAELGVEPWPESCGCVECSRSCRCPCGPECICDECRLNVNECRCDDQDEED